MRRREAIFCLALFCGSLVAGFGLLELGCRVWRGPHALLDWSNLATAYQRRNVRSTLGVNMYDPLLGYVSRPGYRSQRFNHDRYGFRRPANEAPPADLRDAIATAGDSFVYGAEVTDGETWPAYLARLTGTPTLNAGVSSYGLDQAVLRAKDVAERFHPSAVVVGFIADDLRRTEMRRFSSVPKSFFVPGPDGSIVLHNVPVPTGPDAFAPSTAQRLLGWSVLADTVAEHLGLRDQWLGEVERALPAGTGAQLACPLMRLLATIPAPVLVVAQYDPDVWRVDHAYAAEQIRLSRLVLDCARAAHLATLDTFDAVDKAVRELGVDALYRTTHHGACGNALVARAIAAALGRPGQKREQRSP